MSPLRVLEIAELDFRLEPQVWPFLTERAADIAAHWEARRASQPSLFNGRVLLLGRHEIATRADGKLALRGAYFEVDFAAFLAWRDFGFPGGEVCNGFSMAALRGADGAFLLGEMAAHTANAGAVYFAAGTPDRQDVFGERVDLTASVTRELEEETGVPASETHYDGNWTVIYDPPRIACMKIMRLDVSSIDAKTRIEAFLASEAKPELSRMHIARRASDLEGLRAPEFVKAFLDHEAANPQR